MENDFKKKGVIFQVKQVGEICGKLSKNGNELYIQYLLDITQKQTPPETPLKLLELFMMFYLGWELRDTELVFIKC